MIKTVKQVITVLLTCSLAYSLARAWAGVSSAEFLLIGVGARAQGLGNAYTAVTDDVNSIYWNQAGLAALKSPQASFMHNAWLDNMTYDYVALGVPTKAGTFGLSVHYLNIGRITGRASQVSAPYSFTADDQMVSLGYGAKIIPRGYAGFSLKFIKERIDDITAQGLAADAGLMYRLPASNLSFGFSARNIGGGIKYVNETEKLPLIFSLGAGYRIGGFGLGMDIKHYAYENSSELAFGTEFAPVSAIALRGGMLYSMLAKSSSTDISSTGETLSPSGGVGFRFGGSQVDYSFTLFNQLGTTHKLSLTFGF